MSMLLELVRSVPAEATQIPHSRPTIVAEDIEAVTRVLESGMIAEGRMCETFEERLAEYVGTPGAVVTGTGTQALELALLALDIKPGDRVAIPTYVCRSVWDACRAVGAEVLLIDSGEDYNIDINQLAEVAGQCRAAIVPHIMGIVADIPRIRESGISVIEDCAQAIGGEFAGRRLGTFGDIAVFSFHAVKVMTTGEGGALTAQSPDMVEKIRRLKHDCSTPMQRRHLYAMTDIQAALGLSQLKRLDRFIETRRLLAGRYFAELQDSNVELPHAVRERSMFFRFPVRIGNDNRSAKEHAERYMEPFVHLGVAVRLPVCELLHRKLGKPAEDYPTAERHLRQTLGLPIYPSLSPTEQERVIDVARQVFRSYKHDR